MRLERSIERLAPPPHDGGGAAEPDRPCAEDGLVPGTLWLAVGGALRCRTPRSLHVLPPTLALWMPWDTPQQVEPLGGARLRRIGLPLSADLVGPNAMAGRVTRATPLLAALLDALDDGRRDARSPARRAMVVAVAQNEMQAAATLPIGIALPRPGPLHTACEAALQEPAGDCDLQALAEAAGTSTRSLARAFQDELALPFSHWRLQLRLARLVALWADGRTLADSARAIGYRSPSALSFMVRRVLGMPPSRLLASRPGAAR